MRRALARSPSAGRPHRAANSSKRCSSKSSSAHRSSTPNRLVPSGITKTSEAARTTTKENSMLIEETIEKLLAMRLPTMAAATREILQNAPSEQLSFEDKLGLVVDREWTER